MYPQQQAKPGQNPYLRTKILTASPEELRLMLYDGAIKFCNQAKLGLENKNFEESYNNISRAQKIVLELSTSLDHKIAPELCEKMSSLYNYIYRKLIDANTQHTLEDLQEAVDLLKYERETWVLLMQKLKEEGNPRDAIGGGTNTPTQGYAPDPGARQTAMSTWSESA